MAIQRNETTHTVISCPNHQNSTHSSSQTAAHHNNNDLRRQLLAKLHAQSEKTQHTEFVYEQPHDYTHTRNSEKHRTQAYGQASTSVQQQFADAPANTLIDTHQVQRAPQHTHTQQIIVRIGNEERYEQYLQNLTHSTHKHYSLLELPQFQEQHKRIAHTIDYQPSSHASHALGSICLQAKSSDKRSEQKHKRSSYRHTPYTIPSKEIIAVERKEEEINDSNVSCLTFNRKIHSAHDSNSIIERHNFERDFRIEVKGKLNRPINTIENKIVESIEEKTTTTSPTRIITLQNKNVPSGIQFAIAVKKNIHYTKNALKKITRKLADQMK